MKNQDRMNQEEKCRGLPLFRKVASDDNSWKTIWEKLAERSVPAGEEIVREGVSYEEMLILVEGEAALSRSTLRGNPFSLGKLEGLWGEFGLIGAEQSACTVKAVTACHFLVFTRQKFAELGEFHPQLAWALMWELGQLMVQKYNKVREERQILFETLVTEIGGER